LAKAIIVGSGFSAFVASKLLEKSNVGAFQIISAKNIQKYADKLEIKRNKNLEVNKLFSTKGFSFGSLSFYGCNTVIHDRLVPGGNTCVWGGFLNKYKLPKPIIKLLEDSGISLVSLSVGETGSWSNCDGIVQLQDKTKSIFLSNIEAENGYVKKIIKRDGKLYLESFYSRIGRLVTEEVSHAILCLGSYQLIDLLFRSGFLSDADRLTLSEWSHGFNLIRGGVPLPDTSQSIVIRYNTQSAIRHSLGYRTFCGLFDFRVFSKPLIQQEFKRDINSATFRILGGILTGTSFKKFGSSIHYYNLCINDVPIIEFLRAIDSNIICIGMPAVSNHQPGPISNDIALLAYKSLLPLSNSTNLA
jgi:hypothetical protein